DNIFNKGNFFLSKSSFPLFTPKNSIGLTVSRLMMVSVNLFLFRFLNHDAEQMLIVRMYLSQYNFQFQVHQSYLLTNWGKQALDYMNNFKSYATSKKEERMS